MALLENKTLDILSRELRVRFFMVGDRLRAECFACRKRINFDYEYVQSTHSGPKAIVEYLATIVSNHFGICEKNPQLMLAKASVSPQPEPQKRPYSRRFEME